MRSSGGHCRRGRYRWEKEVHGHIRYPLDGLQAFLKRLQVQQGRLPAPFPGRLPAGGGEAGIVLTSSALATRGDL